MITTLKPGLLVSLHTTLKGGVQYARQDLGKEVKEDGAKVEEWQTKKTVDDPAEHDAGIKARSKCRSLVAGVCSQSAFGLLCLGADEKKLDDAIREAREHADAFNATAQLSRVDVFVLKGRIAETEQEAVRAISGEMRGILDEMKGAVDAGNAEKIRDAAMRAKKVGKMLDDETGKKVAAAIEEAREVAKKIVKAASTGEDVAAVVQAAKLDAIASARFAFIDMSEDLEIAGEPMAPTVVRNLDLGEEEEMPLEGEVMDLARKLEGRSTASSRVNLVSATEDALKKAAALSVDASTAEV